MRFALVLASGCMMMHNATPTPDPGDKANLTSCDASMALVGSEATVSNAVSLDVDSIGWCLHVDASTMPGAPILFAQTVAVADARSDIELSVLDGTGTALQSGWDVTSGQALPMTFAEVQWQMTTGQVTDVILRARAYPAKDTTLTAKLDPGLD